MGAMKGSAATPWLSGGLAGLALTLCATLGAAPALGAVSGLWWDPAKEGQGVAIFEEGPVLCGAWYLYDENGEDMWLTFTGPLGGTLFTAPLYRFSGPPLGGPWDTDLWHSDQVGSILLSFLDANTATMAYSVNGHAGSLNLSPFANDAAGLWWDPLTPGQGVAFFQEGAVTYLVWYAYDAGGGDMWLTSLAPNAGEPQPLYRFTGSPLGSPWNTDLVKSAPVGTATFTLMDAISAAFTASLYGASADLDLTPFACPGSAEGSAACPGLLDGTWLGLAPVLNPSTLCLGWSSAAFNLCNGEITGWLVDQYGLPYTVTGAVDDLGRITSGVIVLQTDSGLVVIGTLGGTFGSYAMEGAWSDTLGCYGTLSLSRLAP